MANSKKKEWVIRAAGLDSQRSAGREARIPLVARLLILRECAGSQAP